MISSIFETLINYYIIQIILIDFNFGNYNKSYLTVDFFLNSI